MAKDLPYFKFYTGEWIAGDITLCSIEAQGVFTNIMAHYWNRGCSMSLANAKQRFSNYIASLEELIFQKIIKLDEEDNIVINFLDEQMDEFISLSERRAIAGSKGGKAKAKQLPSKAKAKPSNKEERRGDNNIEIIQQQFKDEVREYKDKYDSNMLKAFWEYWSEPNKAKTKMRKDMQKTWDTGRRLSTWANNNFSK